MKSRYVYNGDILCVPGCRMPYYCCIYIFSISAVAYETICSTVQQIQTQSLAELSEKKGEEFKSWRTLYEKEKYCFVVDKDKYVFDDNGYYIFINEMLTDQAVQYIVGSNVPKSVKIEPWKPLSGTIKESSWD